MSGAWELYDALIEAIPAEPVVDDCIIGLNWTYIRAGGYMGIAATLRGSSDSGLAGGPIIGRRLRDVAAGLRSWDMLRASAGMAAVNAWFNSPEKMVALGLAHAADDLRTGTGENIFSEPLESLLGKKVAVIGHFPYIEKQLGGKCVLSVLEREPEGGDYPDSACEYLLEEQDFVFITGMTLTNKTLPRLLTLTENAKTILVGPSSPITPLLFHCGVDAIAGFYVTDRKLTRALVGQAAHREIFRGGSRATFSG